MKIAVLLTNPIQHEISFLRAISKYAEHEVDVVYYSDEGSQSFDYFGLKDISYGLPMLSGYRSVILKNISPFKNYKFRFISPGILKALIRGQYNLILMYGYQSPTSLLALIYAKLFKIPVLQRSEGESVQKISNLKKNLRKLIYPRIYNCFDGFTALCEANKMHYLEYGVKENDIALVPQTVNDDFFSKPDISRYPLLKLQFNINEDDIVFIYGSKLRKEKSPMDAIIAFCMLNNGVNAKLIMLSDGPERKVCEDYVKRHDLKDKIVFTGYVSFEDMRDLFNLSDVLIMTSSETIGATLYQALISGLAIISSDKVPASIDLVKVKMNGFIYPYGNTELLRSYIELIIYNQTSLPLMKQHSKRLSLEYTSENSAKHFYQFIDRKRYIG